jgi:hypothetical protein
MKRTIFFFAIMVITIDVLAQGVSNNRTIDDIVYNTRRRVNSLNLQYNGKRNNKFENKLSENIYKLKDLLDDKFTIFSQVSDIDSLFRQSLLVNYKALENESINLELINDLIEDFSIKANAFRLGLKQNNPTYVHVQVTTFDTSLRKTSGYIVYWNFWLQKNNKSAAATFLDFTNPSSYGYLAPGLYDIWVQKINKTKRFPSEKRYKRVVSLNGNEKIISISIPVE